VSDRSNSSAQENNAKKRDARAERLAKALRENVKRRRQQNQERVSDDAPPNEEAC
jgi:hypothetical protein